MTDSKEFHALNDLNDLIDKIRRTEDSGRLLQSWIACHPDDYQAMNRLADLLFQNGRVSDAVQCYREVVKIHPDHQRAFRVMGNAFRVLGKVEDAIDCYRAALAIKQDRATHSRLLLAMNYSSRVSLEETVVEHKRWAQLYALPLQGVMPAHDNVPDRNRTLHIGYVSPDFKSHPVSYFFAPIIKTHDRARFRVICYSNVQKGDGVTRGLKSQADVWRDIAKLDDKRVCETIREDGIDILVDLAGHTSGNRLTVFARKPAPLQISYLGYPNTTGLDTIDYRLTDHWTDPPGDADGLCSEKLERLPNGFLCFEPPDNAPAIVDPPVLANGYITFGSFNKISKVTDEVIAVWAKILNAVPRSRLLIKTQGLEQPAEKQRVINMFVDAGLGDPTRVEIIGLVPSRTQHLSMYGRVDIGLDPFPYNGTTTTCQAVWMGVPVISLTGDRHVSRVGLSIASQLGLVELAVQGIDDYVDTAITLASDPSHLRNFRRAIRQTMATSSLTNKKDFVAALEVAYRRMWIEWCERRVSG